MRWRPKRRRTLGGIKLAIVLTLLTIGAGGADFFVLHPTTEAVDPGKSHRTTFAAQGGGVIEAWTSRSFDDADAPDAYVLAFTGNEQRAEKVADYNASRWSPRRVEVWTINFPGYGGTTGPARLRTIAPNSLAAYDELARHANGKPIYVTSNSLGGTAAMYVASHRRVAGLIVQNPPALREIIMGQGWWNLWLLSWPASLRVPDELEAPDSACHVTAPAIFIMAESDNRVMPKYQQLTIDAFAGEKRQILLKHKGHDDTIDSPEEWRTFHAQVDWLWSHGQ